MGSLLVGMEFQHILRLLNTNVDGKEKIMYALTSIKGIGRRFANICCKKAEVDMKKRAGRSADRHGPLLHPHLPSLPCRTFAACTTVCFHTGYLCPHPMHPAGECSAEELERLMTIVANPRQYKIPDWFLNRQKDHKTGRFTQVRSGRAGGLACLACPACRYILYGLALQLHLY